MSFLCFCLKLYQLTLVKLTVSCWWETDWQICMSLMNRNWESEFYIIKAVNIGALKKKNFLEHERKMKIPLFVETLEKQCSIPCFFSGLGRVGNKEGRKIGNCGQREFQSFRAQRKFFFQIINMLKLRHDLISSYEKKMRKLRPKE